MSRRPPCLLGSLAYLLPGSLLAGAVADLPGLLGGWRPEPGTYSAVSLIVFGAGYVALLVWLKRRAEQPAPKAPYIVATLLYWPALIMLMFMFGMMFGHCAVAAAAEQAACASRSSIMLTTGFALAAAAYGGLLWRLHRTARRRRLEAAVG